VGHVEKLGKGISSRVLSEKAACRRMCGIYISANWRILLKPVLSE
jgi:hypothetical protein